MARGRGGGRREHTKCWWCFGRRAEEGHVFGGVKFWREEHVCGGEEEEEGERLGFIPFIHGTGLLHRCMISALVQKGGKVLLHSP
jgi:hypothetical protein